MLAINRRAREKRELTGNKKGTLGIRARRDRSIDRQSRADGERRAERQER